MMVLNKVVAKSPTPLADLNMTLTDLGLEAQQLSSGPFGNVDNKNPDELTIMYQSANQQVWWLMTTTELYNSISNQQGLVPTIPGFLNMPFFDKVLMGGNSINRRFQPVLSRERTTRPHATTSRSQTGHDSPRD